MRNLRFDWRWLALIVFVAILANARALPWVVVALTLGAAGAYLLSLAWAAWGIGGGRRDTRRVTYWRGQKIESSGPTRRYRPRSWDELAPIALYGIIGLALALAALSVTLRNLAPSWW